LLGLATIGTYGAASYAAGVFVPAIADDTGWGAAAPSAGVSIAILGQGAVALLAGKILDSSGSRAVLLPSLVGGGLLLLLASVAQEPWQFIVAWASGASIIGGCLFYNVTMPITARLYPAERAAAFSTLTLLGALASPVFYPIAGFLIDEWGWRHALQGLIGLMVLFAAPAALIIRVPGARVSKEAAQDQSLVACLKEPAIHRLLVVLALVGFAHSALLLSQVPAMQAAGLTLATASWFAGLRGLFQIPGRLLLTPLIARFGLRGTMVVCYVSAVTAGLALLVALQGQAAWVLVLYFSVIGGMSLGLRSPLTGLLQAEVFGDARLGLLSGIALLLSSLASALGALLSGVLVDVTDSYGPTLALVLAAYGLTLITFAWQGRARTDSTSLPPVSVSPT
ncbi:MAG: MFS transporter, partial [Dehalococcoidia bacterium]